jgi:hypothetical protein
LQPRARSGQLAFLAVLRPNADGSLARHLLRVRARVRVRVRAGATPA